MPAELDQTLYKTFTVSRGFTYNYYFSPPKESNGEVYLLFVHGFPFASFGWRNQIPYFQEKGYGIVAPDLLGYGRTSKSDDPNDFKASLIGKDLIDIIDCEKAEKVIAVGHDM